MLETVCSPTELEVGPTMVLAALKELLHEHTALATRVGIWLPQGTPQRACGPLPSSRLHHGNTALSSMAQAGTCLNFPAATSQLHTLNDAVGTSENGLQYPSALSDLFTPNASHAPDKELEERREMVTVTCKIMLS